MFQRLRHRVTKILHRKDDDAARNLAGVQDEEAMRIVKDEEEDEQEAQSPYPPSHAFQPKRVDSIIAVLGSHHSHKVNELEKFSRYRQKNDDVSSPTSTTGVSPRPVSSSGVAGVRPFAGRKLSIMDHPSSQQRDNLSSIHEIMVPSSRSVVERRSSKPAENNRSKSTATSSTTTVSPNHPTKRRSNPFAWKYETIKATSSSPRRSSTSTTTMDSVSYLEEASSDNSFPSTTTMSDPAVEDDDDDTTPTPPTLLLEPMRGSFRTTTTKEEKQQQQEEPTIATTITAPPTTTTAPAAAPANDDDPLGDLEMELNPVRELRWRLRSKYMGHMDDDDTEQQQQQQHNATEEEGLRKKEDPTTPDHKYDDSPIATPTKNEEQSMTGRKLSEGGHVLYDTKNTQYRGPAPRRLGEDRSKDDKVNNTHTDSDDPMRRRRKPTLMRASKRSSALDFVEPEDDDDDDEVKKPSRRTLSYVTGLVFANDDDEDLNDSDEEMMLSFPTLERVQHSWTTAETASSPLQQSPRSRDKENSQNDVKGLSSSFRGFSSSRSQRRLSSSSSTRRLSSRRLLVDGSTSAAPSRDS